MLGKLLDTLRRLSAPSEDSHEYDGVLSYAGEYHAIGNGLYKGFVAIRPRKAPPTEPDSKKELHYYRFGYVVGYLGKVGILALSGINVF